VSVLCARNTLRAFVFKARSEIDVRCTRVHSMLQKNMCLFVQQLFANQMQSISVVGESNKNSHQPSADNR
jgi:hypothetical protein